MPMSMRTRLAHAKRVLRRLQEDEPYLRKRISEYSATEQELVLKLFSDSLEKQRAFVAELEAELKAADCR